MSDTPSTFDPDATLVLTKPALPPAKTLELWAGDELDEEDDATDGATEEDHPEHLH